MNAKEIKLKIDALEKELESLKGELKEKMESEWPKHGDSYYFISENGFRRPATWAGSDNDDFRKSFHNVFKTVKELEKERTYLTFERQVRAKAAELNDGWVADWGDNDQAKWQMFSHDNKVMVRGSECKSEEVAHALLNHFGADKFLAYATGGDL